jgi:hypothetical protein
MTPLRILNNIDSIYELASVTEQQLLTRLIAKSFFLPADVLKHQEYSISDILILSRTAMLEMTGKLPIHVDGDEALFSHSRFVGVSIRVNKTSKEAFIVSKTWYGIPRRTSSVADIIDIITLYRNQL